MITIFLADLIHCKVAQIIAEMVWIILLTILYFSHVLLAFSAFLSNNDWDSCLCLCYLRCNKLSLYLYLCYLEVIFIQT